MRTKCYLPKQPHPIVQAIFEIQADPNDPQRMHFVPPMGAPELVFYLGNRHQIQNVAIRDGFIKGQYDNPQRIFFQPDYHFIAIRLHPYGIYQLFGLNAKELVNAVIDAQAHELTRALAALFEQTTALDIPCIQQALALLDQQPLYPISPDTLAFLRLAANDSSTSIADMLHHQGIQIRSLQRHFAKEIGLSPKKWLRILRLMRLESQLQTEQPWMELVGHFDFTDQSHLIKEFKALREYAPQALLAQKLRLVDQFPPPERTLI